MPRCSIGLAIASFPGSTWQARSVFAVRLLAERLCRQIIVAWLVTIDARTPAEPPIRGQSGDARMHASLLRYAYLHVSASSQGRSECSSSHPKRVWISCLGVNLSSRPRCLLPTFTTYEYKHKHASETTSVARNLSCCSLAIQLWPR